MGSSTSKNRAIIVPASAGSGKTYRIAHEYIYDVLRNRIDEEGNPYFDRQFYKRILAVTFTNKATEEMKSRILGEIHLLASGAKSDHLADLVRETGLDEATLRQRAQIVRSLILHDYSHFTVLTNDTFFQRILRAFVRELGIDINFSTELDTAPLLAKGVDALIEDITSNTILRKWLEELTEERISQGEKWNIRNALTALSDELFKESTRDIIEKKSDKELLKRAIHDFAASVNKQKTQMCEIGKEALRAIAERGYTHDNFKSNFTAIFEKIADGTIDKFTEAKIKKIDCPLEEWFAKNKATEDLLNLAAQLQTLLGQAHLELVKFKTLENTLSILRRNYRGFALLHDLHEKVEDICRQENSMLLSETKHAIAGFLSESEAPFIYEKVGNYFDKFMIDEFQDTSLKEWHNFLPLLRNATSQSSDTSVLIVGDVKQSIYRWRGGDWRILGGEVVRDLPDSETTPLENNWRSLPNIVEFNNLLFSSVVNLENKRLNEELERAHRTDCISQECYNELYNTLQNAYANHSQIPRRKHTNCGYISITSPVEMGGELCNDEGMPLYIERIRQVLERGYLPRDITILVRKRSHGMEIAEELMRYREAFPEELRFDITTEEALSIATSPAVKLIIAVMRLAINRKDSASLALYNHLHNNDRFDKKLSDKENTFLDSIRMMSPEEAFEHIAIRYDKDLQGQTAYVMALHEQIVHFSAGKVADLSLFDEWWKEKSEKLSIRVERSDRALEILTIHKAKGLENKVVMIPRCSWWLAPQRPSGRITNIVWSKPAPNPHLDAIGEFPVSVQSNAEESLFADAFFRETVYSAIDGINLLYVATTRAKEQLHIFAPYRKKAATVDRLLLDIYGERMQTSADNSYRSYEVGQFDTPEPERKSNDEGKKSSVITEHKASPVTLKLRTNLARYFADEESELTPRSMGIRLHRAFEGASTREEIFATLDEMAVNGELNASDIAEIKAQVEHTLETTIAGEWFDGSWEQLHRERSIIRPDGTTKRPDRVLTRGNEAVVVDYKFGEEMKGYNRQIAEYMSLLQAMGYSSVNGYLWYVPTGKIVRIEE